MFCSKCGNELKDGDNVCSQCGNVILKNMMIADLTQKSRLGISTRLLAVITYLLGLTGGYIVLCLIAGYILLAEDDKWLKNIAIKAVVICGAFLLMRTFINFIPDILSGIGYFVAIFGGQFSIPIITKLCGLATVIVSLSERIILLLCGFAAYNGENKIIEKIDSIIALHTR